MGDSYLNGKVETIISEIIITDDEDDSIVTRKKPEMDYDVHQK